LQTIGPVLAVLLVAVAVLLAFTGGDGGPAAPAPDETPRLVGEADLRELEGTLGHPVYWAGERPPDRLELRQEADGSVYLRYLPPGVEAGDPRQGFLTIGTYPLADPVAALRRTAAKAGTEVERRGSAVVLESPTSPSSAYLAQPGSGLQIETYDPRPGVALHLVRAGAIGPVG
jgi:hypothetical protein